ncbi:MAG TPA: YceI family protein [Dehalococcoidia bacterium]|nr:YceI family protein [Dehalococcoidia bacterium]
MAGTIEQSRSPAWQLPREQVLPRALAAGLVAGGVIGVIGTLICVPLRRWAGVTDRAVINGYTIAGGSLALWLLGGLLYGALARRGGRAAAWLLSAALAIAILGTIVFAGPARDLANRLPSLAVPLTLLVVLGGAALFLAIVGLRAPWRIATPAAVVAALVVGFAVTVADREPKVHFTLTKLTVPPAATRAAPAQAAAPASAPGPADANAAAPVTPAATASTPGAATGTLHFVVNPQSQAAYTVHEKLTRLPAPSDAIGRTSAITGDLYLEKSSGLAPSRPSAFTVELSTLTSDTAQRDRFLKQSVLQVARFPNATFTITGIEGFPASYKEGDQVTISVTGTMNIHGVEKPLTWTGQAQEAGGKLEAVVSTDFQMQDFGIQPPSVPVVQSVDSHVHLDLHLFADQQGS